MSTPDDGLSKYELERLDNIRRNQEHLTYLGLEAAPSASARRETKRPRREPSLRPQVAPSRSSARIDGASAPDVFVESETAHGIERAVRPREQRTSVASRSRAMRDRASALSGWQT